EPRVVRGRSSARGDGVEAVAVLAQVLAERLQQGRALVEGELPQRGTPGPPAVLEGGGEVDPRRRDPRDLLAGDRVEERPALLGRAVPATAHVAAQDGRHGRASVGLAQPTVRSGHDASTREPRIPGSRVRPGRGSRWRAIAGTLDGHREEVAMADRGTASVETLEAIADAFNAHDLGAIMEFFAEDCALDMPRGPDPWGRRCTGKAAVRDALASRFAGLPDVHYGDARHWV